MKNLIAFLTIILTVTSCGIFSKEHPDNIPVDVTTIKAIEPEVILKGKVYTEEETDFVKFGGAVITSETEYDRLLTEVNKFELKGELSPVDFSSEMIILFFDEMRESGGYDVAYQTIIEDNTEILVNLTFTSPDPDMAYTEVLNRPYILAKIPKSSKSVQFK